jgi:predicted acyltransferase
MSVDALRGFAMFWIIGADALFYALGKMFPSGPIHSVALQLDHVEWEGLRFYDLIFPTFVFVVGISIVFSIQKIVSLEGKAEATRRILRRGLLLYMLGLFYYGGFSGHFDRIRLVGVLQRLAICYTCAGLLYCWLRPRSLILICIGILLGYWALLAWVPVPGVGAGNYAEGKNLTNYIDREYLPLRKWDGDHDPEGLLSNLPAVASCLLGVFAGLILRDGSMDDRKRTRLLILGGLALLATGFVWSFWFPIIKKIWSSSYVLMAAGYSTLFLVVFYWLIDVKKTANWAQPFVWIGMNAITAYMLDNLVDFGKIGARLAGGDLKDYLNAGVHQGFGDLLAATAGLASALLIMRFLYKQKIFLRL